MSDEKPLATPETAELSIGAEKPLAGTGVEKPMLAPKPESSRMTLEWESDEGRAERANLCAQALKDALEKYECIVTVPTIDISTGRCIPIPQIVPAPRKLEPSRIVTPDVPFPRVLKRS